MILLRACHEWMNLRLQDFKIVTEHNSIVFNISSQFKLCGEKITYEDLLKKKTFSTFHDPMYSYNSNIVKRVLRSILI